MINENINDQPICSICLAGYENLENVCLLPCCDNMFHFQCVRDWIESNQSKLKFSCPLCRQKIDLIREQQNPRTRKAPKIRNVKPDRCRCHCNIM